MASQIALFIATFIFVVAPVLGVCPGDSSPCSGHGTCGAWDLCTCYRNWQGPDCADRTCPFGLSWADVVDTTVSNRAAHFYAECSDKGKCDRKTGNCECYAGYEGKACARMACPKKCNGHGTCELYSHVNPSYTGWDKDKTQVCVCDPGYYGNDCGFRMCKPGDDPLTLQTVDAYTYQEDEVQTITFTDSGSGAITGTFSLTYQDWRGESWVTHPIDIATATTISVEEALVAIPNHAIPDVTVTSSGAATSGDLSFTITFTSGHTPGDQAPLVVNYDACVTAGCQPVLTGLTATNTLTVTVAEATKGTEELNECSNRGKCNLDTGVCKCFAGYYGEACEMQTIIA